MNPMLIVLMIACAALLVVGAVAVVSIRAGQATAEANKALVSDVAHMLKARDLDEWAWHKKTEEEKSPAQEQYQGDPELQGFWEAQQQGLNLTQVEDFEAYQQRRMQGMPCGDIGEVPGGTPL